eukprot:CAMPEP_0113615892 /NCGR_PEP_ID=MMETSP0017_2-20120614/7945_1 /TAXON_ID=2856 /ORGANISM="Cylindrotheca closterium" /LENGTH=1002 /DNA_ID=CAMNT_0000525163 /DNA_START=225 /DNA_END=3233 /DNA_ORIENTATION=+ /assembly_acc=CAM_ASM_000147
MNVQQGMWPTGGTLNSQQQHGMAVPVTTMSTPVHFFPNGLQLNQMWMDSLAKGMTQEQVSHNNRQTQQIRQQQQQQYQPQPQQPQASPQTQHQQQYVQAVQVQQQQQQVNTISPMPQRANVMTAAASGFPQATQMGLSTTSPLANTTTFASPVASMQVVQQTAPTMLTTATGGVVPNRMPQAPTLNPTVTAIQQQQQQLGRGLVGYQQQPQKMKPAGRGFPEGPPIVPVIDQVAAEKERKRKNREFAKRSREKRKNEHKHLEDELRGLQKENVRLRQIVQDKIPGDAQEILKNCCKDHPLHAATVKQGVNDALAMSDFHLLENLIKEQQSFCMTDPKQPDNPIVYASENFYQLTGYTKAQTLGRNCRFLQGKDTDPKSVALIRENIKNGKDTSVNILNYKANGTPFWNEFFIVALRNHTGKIVNFVGVQCEIEDPNNENITDDSIYKVIEQKNKSIRIKGPAGIGGMPTEESLTLISEGDIDADSILQPTPMIPTAQTIQPLDANNFNGVMDDENRVDWSMLANVLEDDFRSGIDDWDNDNNTASIASMGDCQSEAAETEYSEADTAANNEKRMIAHAREAELEYQDLTPRALVTRTCRSELVDSLLSVHGDVTNERFLKALEVMSSIYASSDPGKPIDDTEFLDNFLNSAWVSLSRPAYDGCLGKTGRGDYIYALGKMSFNMFKPGSLKCSIQHTLNKISYVCDMNEARNQVPWSLRRELAMTEEDGHAPSGMQQKTLRSYDIEIAMTIQPNEELGLKKPLRAIQILHGYMLRDPNENNRLSVWFTGGKLVPFMPDDSMVEMMEDDEYGTFEDWKAIFDQEYTSSWSESFQNIGAKLFLGAQLPSGMKPDGSLNYSLTRPYGGHGKSFIDVLYLDEGLLVTRGNNGTIHVMVRSNLLCPTQGGDSQMDGAVKSATEVSGAPDSTNKPKRKAAVMDEVPSENNEVPDQANSNSSAAATLSWQEQLRRDLANRNPDSIANDLSSILQEYGIQIDPATKKAKLS